MKRIVVFVHNEEMEALKPLRTRLQNAGALVIFHALKYLELVKADQVLTREFSLDAVKKVYAGTNIPVSVIIEDDTKQAKTIEAAPKVEVPEAPVFVPPEDEAIVITVGEAPAPTPALKPARSRPSK